MSRLLSAPVPALQRTLTILSYDVGKRGPDNADLDVGAVRTAIQRAVTGADQATVLANLLAADRLGWQGPDVVALATHLCARTRTNPLNLVAEAIGSTLLAEGTNADEGRQFEQARLAATSMSRSKGTPNQIALAPLDRALGGAGIAGIMTAIGALDAQLATPQGGDDETLVDNWPVALAGTLNVREAHGNAAGWITPINIATRLGALSGIVDGAYNRANARWKQDKGEPFVRHTLINNKLRAAEDRRFYVWGSYAQGVSPFIEFSVPGHKDLRVVFDFVNRRYYFTVHYKWYKGYNPFFLIT